MGYSLALMPFDAVVLTNRFEGLCPPGLGLIRYAAMCKAFMELLPWLVPVTISPQVSAALAAVRYELNNGYDYLWRVMELGVPGFDPTVPIHIPSWANANDIFNFAQAYLLHFRLQAKLNFHYDDHTRSGIFLRAIQYSEFADTVTTLQAHMNSFRQEFNDGYLPPHLRLHGLTTSIHNNAQGRLRNILTPNASTATSLVSRVSLLAIVLVGRTLLVVAAFRIVVMILLIALVVVSTIVGVAHRPLPETATLTVADIILGDAANWHARTVTAVRSCQMSNALCASVWDTWQNIATCLPLQSVWNGT